MSLNFNLFIMQHRDNQHSSGLTCQLSAALQVNWDLWEKVGSVNLNCGPTAVSWDAFWSTCSDKPNTLYTSPIDIPTNLWLQTCTDYQRLCRCESREARGSCAFCPTAKSVKAHWDLPSPRRAPRQPVAALWYLRSWNTMTQSADNTMHRMTSGC